MYTEYDEEVEVEEEEEAAPSAKEALESSDKEVSIGILDCCAQLL